MVDPKGIEPLSPVCRTGILPLNYEPKVVTPRRIELLFSD